MSGDARGEGQPKTAQPFADDVKKNDYEGMTGGEPKPRPDAVGDREKQAEAGKVTQRQE